MSVLEPKTYMVKVGDLQVDIDFDARAIYVKRNSNPVYRSEEREPGFVLDYDRDGAVVGAEFIASRGDEQKGKP